MNLIPLIPKGSCIEKSSYVATIVYTLLLSDAKKARNKIVSNCSLDALYSKLSKKTFTEEAIEVALEELEESGLLIVNDKTDTVVLGDLVEEVPHLFSGEVGIDAVAELESLISFIRMEEKNSSSSRRRAVYSEHRQVLSSIKDMPISTLKVAHFANLFTAVYETTYESDLRPFLAKEYGQLKTMLKLFSADVLIVMICKYVANVEVFHKWPPTVGNLLYHKDEIYLFITSKTKKDIIRKEDKEHGF